MGRPLGSMYVIEELLGRGGMGEVYRAVGRGGAEYAAKVLRPELANDQAIVSRFVQERSILVGVRNPNLVAVHDLVVEGRTLAIVMDLVRGPDLRRGLQSVGSVPPAEVARLGAEIAAALAAVHAADVVHRDVKPENVLLDQAERPPRVRLTDFGISRLFGPGSQARTTMLMGTPLYLAPEIAHGGQASPATDLYSLGAMLYELCCGVAPFFGGEIATVIHAHTALDPGRPAGIPDPLWDLIAWMLAKQPAARPQSAAQVAATLRGLEQRLAGLPAAHPIRTPPRGRLSPNPFIVMGAEYGSGETVQRPGEPAWPLGAAGSPLPVAMSPGASPGYAMPTPPYPGSYPVPPAPIEAGTNRVLITVCLVLALLLGAGGISWAMIATRDTGRSAGASRAAAATAAPEPSAESAQDSSGQDDSGTRPTAPRAEAVPPPRPASVPTANTAQQQLRVSPAQPSPEPDGPSIGPAEFVQNYYRLANDDPEYAWDHLLTATAQSRVTGGRDRYLRYWGEEIDAVEAKTYTVRVEGEDTYEVTVGLVLTRHDGGVDCVRLSHRLVPQGDSFRVDDTYDSSDLARSQC